MTSIGPYTLPGRFLLAPMAGVSEQPFRVIARRLGAAACPTELVSAQGLMRANERTAKYLRYDHAVERPFWVQIFGGEVEVMARAALMAKDFGAQVIDINMGCPVKKVTRSGSGSALMCDLPRAAAIVRAVAEKTGLPVTAKIRSGWDHQNRNFLETAAALEEAGCAALAVHPRTRAQGYSGAADWAVIAQVKKASKGMPIIGNGDVKTPADARRMFETTGCDLVMVGRGALGNPWLFRELEGGPPPTAAERRDTVLEHFAAHRAFVASDVHAVRSFRKHLAWYARGLHGAAAFRAEAVRLETAAQVEAAVRRFFSEAGADAALTGDEDLDLGAALG
jgi:nifR3 family TIM-barrel protein